MKGQLWKNFLLVSAGAALALLFSVASAQDTGPVAPPQPGDPPAELDRTFGDEEVGALPGTGGAAQEGQARQEGEGEQESQRPEAEGQGGGAQEGQPLKPEGQVDGAQEGQARDGGSGISEEQEAEPDTGAAATPRQEAGDEPGVDPTADDHTNIIVYGPNGLRRGEEFPEDEEEDTARGGSGEAGTKEKGKD